MIGQTLAHYRIESKLGEGGMGTVYRAIDERLLRPVAIKVVHERSLDPQLRGRLWREARVAAAVNHPNICQIHEIGEDNNAPFIVMELLEGESLASRLQRGPMPMEEAVSACLEMLSALDALHSHHLLHRDLKPSNVFLTRHAIKVLDFGLAKPLPSMSTAPEALTGNTLTLTGTVMGTPQYMSPEQLQGGDVHIRSDIFAAGTILYEMLNARPAFAGRSIPELFHAIVYDSPAALTGSASRLQSALSRSLAKSPEARYSSAEAMASDLRVARWALNVEAPPSPRALTRLVVLPFQELRHDEETAFLCFSLPDAISSSLAVVGSLVVRSSRVGARFAGPSIELKTIAKETEVDAVMTGTLLRSGDQLRVTAELLDATSGTLLWMHRAQAPVHDLFQLQDDLAQRIMNSLAGPLTQHERSVIRRDVPASASAYEFYLRANQLAGHMEDLTLARDLYLQCLEEDSRFAPAWARLARCYRILAKFGATPSDNLARAEQAFERAFLLNPDLPLAHSLYAQHEAERGRARDAIQRLLGRVQSTHNDPELYAGLVYACRYAGLLDASVAADRIARRLDPNVRTTVMNTHFVAGNYQLALDSSTGDIPYVEIMALDGLDRRQEALHHLQRMEKKDVPPMIRLMTGTMSAYIQDKRTEAIEGFVQLNSMGVDPEGFYYRAHCLARLEAIPVALTTLEQAVRKGFYCVPAILGDRYLEPVRATGGFQEILRHAESLFDQAHATFADSGGAQLLSRITSGSQV